MHPREAKGINKKTLMTNKNNIALTAAAIKAPGEAKYVKIKRTA